MRRSSITALLSTLALVACSSAGVGTEGGNASGADGAHADGGGTAEGGSEPGMGSVPGPNGGSKDAGPDTSFDAAPQVTQDGCVISKSPADDACVLRDDLGVFASASKGSDATGDGTMASPFATASHALTFAKAHGKRVFLCAETYAENLTLENGVSMFGGLDCSQPKWTVSATRAHFAAPASPAARADNLTTTTTIEAVEIFAPDATTPSGSSIGLIANASPALGLTNVWIQAGNAMDGTPGSTAGLAAPDNGPNANGTTGGAAGDCLDFLNCVNNANRVTTPGTSACGGGAGGGGGVSGYYVSTFCPAGQLCRMNGQNYYWKQQGLFAAGAGEKNGSKPGNPGKDGASGNWSIDSGGFVAGDGALGTNGGNGSGGNGGDGLPTPYDASLFQGKNFLGFSGAGGGAGGCAGLAGTAGTGGGASVALIATASPLVLKSTKLTASSAGSGKPGSFGVASTAGGAAGNCDPKYPTTCGSAGGKGGEAGVSGSGAGGPSIALAYHGALPSLDAASTLTPGAAGSGVAAQSDGSGRQIKMSSDGVSQPIYSF